MNWTMIAVIAEILSSAAVLVTLIYLAVQTRQNADAIQANTRQAILDADQQLIMAVMASPELDAIFFKPELTDDEKVRLSTFLLTHVRVRENNWFQYQAGVLDHVSWETYRTALILDLSTPRSRTWWQNLGSAPGVFNAEFVSMIDQLVTEAPLYEKSLYIAAFD